MKCQIFALFSSPYYLRIENNAFYKNDLKKTGDAAGIMILYFPLLLFFFFLSSSVYLVKKKETNFKF